MFRSMCCAVGLGALCASTVLSLQPECVVEAPRDIPLVCEVDVLIVGGSSGAVAAACEAAAQGASVFLLAPRPYLGTDMCSTLRLWLEPGERPQSELAIACFGTGRVATPFSVKAAMDRALLQAGVHYLTGCYATDVLRDEDGHIAGVVMASRSGRLAVGAEVVIDATSRAAVARQAEADFRPFAPGPKTFTRVVCGGDARNGPDILSVQKKSFTYDSMGKRTPWQLPVYEYTLRIDMRDNRAESFFRVENRARDLTCQEGSEIASEVLSYTPEDTIIGQRRLHDWPGAAEVDLGPFQPRRIPYLYVLGAYADMDGRAAGQLMRPLALMEVGRRIGRAAAREAQARPTPQTASLPETTASVSVQAEVKEHLGGATMPKRAMVHSNSRALPVLGRYDVVVVGGGTSGAPAGIGAAKDGAKTLVIEYLHELGGVGTTGLIAKYWYGLRRGYTQYVDERVNRGKDSWNAAAKAEWLRRELLHNGADVWFGTLGCGAVVHEGGVCGVVVASPQGRGVVLATTVVDATGNSDVAAWAGAATRYGISELGSLNVQIAGFPHRPLGKSYVNTCYTMVDDTNVFDVWHLMAWKRTAATKTPYFDAGQLVDSRERRRIVGDYLLTVEDILSHRTFPDTISQHFSNFDAAAFPDSRLLLLSDAKGPRFHADLPYRCLLPKGLDGILVVGLGASVQRDAMTLTRMQADLQNQGYAVGMVAAAAARLGGQTRGVDLRALQKRLVAEGVLDARVCTDQDSHPLSAEDIQRAVEAFGKQDRDDALSSLAVILAHPRQATALLTTRYHQFPPGKEQLDCARVLGILGNSTGVAALVAAVDAHSCWDQGMALTSQRNTGNMFSDLDRLVIALGFSGAPKAREPLVRKLAQLRPDSALSHYKAVSLALRGHESPAAAVPLANLLDQLGFAGHTAVAPAPRTGDGPGKKFATLADRYLTSSGDEQANRGNLNRAFKELLVAAMLYRCGDRNHRAEEILGRYALDIHGHFARYARWTLDSGPSPGSAKREAGSAADPMAVD